jgi:hypothetical protein
VHGSRRASGQCPAKRQNLLFLPLGGSPGDGQLADAVDRGVLFESDLVQRNSDPQVRQPTEDRGHGDLELGPGQWLAEALVDAVAEGHTDQHTHA